MKNMGEVRCESIDDHIFDKIIASEPHHAEKTKIGTTYYFKTFLVMEFTNKNGKTMRMIQYYPMDDLEYEMCDGCKNMKPFKEVALVQLPSGKIKRLCIKCYEPNDKITALKNGGIENG